LWSIGQALGASFDVPTRDAWRLALNAICLAMKGGPHLTHPVHKNILPL
jgi:hypothetical protein